MLWLFLMKALLVKNLLLWLFLMKALLVKKPTNVVIPY
jgi:hypothetical protein